MTAGVVALQPLANSEILCKYADVLRVGHLDLNGKTIRWDTSNGKQLESFCQEFVGGLRQLEPLSPWDTSALCRAVHWFCKAVSINYVLSEVLSLFTQKFGAQCAVRTTSSKGESLVGYKCEVFTRGLESTMRVSVNFSGKGNIICCKPGSAKTQVKGTLSCLQTEFPLPPEAGYTPTFHLHMTLRGSRTSRFVARVARTCSAGMPPALEKVLALEPLDSPCDAPPGGKPVLSTASQGDSTSAGRSGGLSDPDDDDDEALLSVPLSFTPHSVRWDVGQTCGLPPGRIRL